MRSMQLSVQDHIFCQLSAPSFVCSNLQCCYTNSHFLLYFTELRASVKMPSPPSRTSPNSPSLPFFLPFFQLHLFPYLNTSSCVLDVPHLTQGQAVLLFLFALWFLLYPELFPTASNPGILYLVSRKVKTFIVCPLPITTPYATGLDSKISKGQILYLHLTFCLHLLVPWNCIAWIELYSLKKEMC